MLYRTQATLYPWGHHSVMIRTKDGGECVDDREYRKNKREKVLVLVLVLKGEQRRHQHLSSSFFLSLSLYIYITAPIVSAPTFFHFQSIYIRSLVSLRVSFYSMFSSWTCLLHSFSFPSLSLPFLFSSLPFHFIHFLRSRCGCYFLSIMGRGKRTSFPLFGFHRNMIS